MKRSFKSLISISLVLTLMFMVLLPANAFAASEPTPTLLYVDSSSETYVYSFQPTAYNLTYGVTTQLKNIFDTDGDWNVPAYKEFTINYNLYNYGSVRLTILKMNGSTFDIVYNNTISGYGSGYSFTNNSSSTSKYRVLITGDPAGTLTSYIASIK